MNGQPEPESRTDTGKRRGSSSRRRIWVSLAVLYLSAGFLLTFTMRTEWIMAAPGRIDFLDTLLNPRIYLSALFWPFWLIFSLF